MIQASRIEKICHNKNRQSDFVNKYENEKKNISEKDQFHMAMQLLQCAYNNEIKKTNEKDIEQVKYKWMHRMEYIKDLWNETLKNKYDVIMAKINMMDIWNTHVEKKNVPVTLSNSNKMDKSEDIWYVPVTSSSEEDIWNDSNKEQNVSVISSLREHIISSFSDIQDDIVFGSEGVQHI